MKFGKLSFWVVAACGSVHNAPGSADAPPSDGTKPRCSPTAAFGTPVAATALNTTASDESAWLTPDELTVYFSSSRPGGVGGYDIYLATRTAPTATFGTPLLLAGVNTAQDERGPELTADGLTLYAIIPTHPYDIAVATRTSASGSFGPLTRVAALDTAFEEANTSLLPDGSAIYLTSNRTNNNYDLYRAERSGASFAAPVPVTGTDLNTAALESSAVVSADELTIYFQSDRANPGSGMYDVYQATRPSGAVGFGVPVALNLDPTGTHNTAPTWVSPDNCVLYLTSTSTAGDYDIYYTVRGN